MANIFRLKAWVRYDGKGRLVGGGPILQESKPKNGDWVEIPFYEYCCQTIPTTTTTSTSTTTTTTTAYVPYKKQYATRNNNDYTILGFSDGLDLNVWGVYAVKFDGSSTTVYQYYNSILQSSNLVAATPIISDPSWGMFLGLRYNQWINAKFGYVAMYDNALSDAQITTIANTLSTRPATSVTPYISGTPELVFDFSVTTSYSNSGTNIADLSGSGNNGVFSFGTGNGIPTTVTGYDSTNGYLQLPGTSSQLSVRLPDALKPTGTVPFTYIVYMQLNGYSYNGDYPGIIAEGNSSSGFTWVVTPI
jgi:hypothetical protein